MSIVMSFNMPLTHMNQQKNLPPHILIDEGPLETRITFLGTDSLKKRILEEAKQVRGDDLSKVIRRALDFYFSPPENTAVTDAENFRAPYLSAVPCGPWSDAIDSGADLVISADIADELEARDGDAWCRADGQSMCGAGILDGDVVLLRPYDGKSPRRGEIVLVQATEEGEEPVGTIKRFDGMDGQRPKLLDGEDKEYALPENTVKVEIVARAVGRYGRL